MLWLLPKSSFLLTVLGRNKRYKITYKVWVTFVSRVPSYIGVGVSKTESLREWKRVNTILKKRQGCWRQEWQYHPDRYQYQYHQYQSKSTCMHRNVEAYSYYIVLHHDNHLLSTELRLQYWAHWEVFISNSYNNRQIIFPARVCRVSVLRSFANDDVLLPPIRRWASVRRTM